MLHGVNAHCSANLGCCMRISQNWLPESALSRLTEGTNVVQACLLH